MGGVGFVPGIMTNQNTYKDTAFIYSYVSACFLLLHLRSSLTFSAQPSQRVLEHRITTIWPAVSRPVTQARASIIVAASSV